MKNISCAADAACAGRVSNGRGASGQDRAHDAAPMALAWFRPAAFQERRAMNKPALLAAVTAGLVVGAVLGVYAPRWFASGAGAPQAVASTQAPAKPVAQRVQVAAVRQVPFARGISAVGSLRSDESVVLRPEVAGRIQSIDFKEGQPVALGGAGASGRLRAARRAGAGAGQSDAGPDSLPARGRTAGQRASSARRRGTSPPARSRCRKPPWRWRRRAWTR